MRDALPELSRHGVAVVGISPDSPGRLKNFHQKHGLGFALLSDPQHAIADDYGTWGAKKMYGKSYMGIVRSAFLIDEKGRMAQVWYKISPKDTVPEVMKSLRGADVG